MSEHLVALIRGIGVGLAIVGVGGLIIAGDVLTSVLFILASAFVLMVAHIQDPKNPEE